ncbi:MAG: type II toxin-antitoxin system VapC family toxin [Chloroflexi bacterium]|nr:type II toxin-antitoxin system VapC family toxin [Chloroflexota bacterium]
MELLDTNVILRYLTKDDEAKAEACYELFEQARQGDKALFTCEAIIAEVVYVLSSPNLYQLSRNDIRARLLPIVSLQGLRIPNKSIYIRALDIYVSHPQLDFEDAIAVSYMERIGLTQIVSYDRDFDRIEDIERIEP